VRVPRATRSVCAPRCTGRRARPKSCRQSLTLWGASVIAREPRPAAACPRPMASAAVAAGGTPLGVRSKRAKMSLVDVAAAWEPSREGTALNSAAKAMDLERLQALVEDGHHPDARDRTGMTALHQAAVLGSVPIIELLLRAGASVNPSDSVSGARTWLGGEASRVGARGAQRARAGKPAGARGPVSVWCVGLADRADFLRASRAVHAPPCDDATLAFRSSETRHFTTRRTAATPLLS